MIWLFFSLFPFVIEFLKYQSFIPNHFFFSANTYADIIFIIGIVQYYKRPKNWINYLFLIFYILTTWIYLNLKYLDQIYFPNYVFSKYHVDWGPLVNIPHRLFLYFLLTEYFKRFHSQIFPILKKWVIEIYNSGTIKTIAALIFIIFSFNGLSEANKIFYSNQLNIMEYLFMNPGKLSKETYIRNKSIGNFYIEIFSFSKYIGKKYELFIPPQTSDWPYEGNMPIVRGIIYPNLVYRFGSENIISGLPQYSLISCGYKTSNTGKCYPGRPGVFNNVYTINNKGEVEFKSTGTLNQIKNTDSIMVVSLN